MVLSTGVCLCPLDKYCLFQGVHLLLKVCFKNGTRLVEPLIRHWSTHRLDPSPVQFAF